MTPQDILDFWFKDHGPAQWFQKDLKFDALIKEKFEGTYWQSVQGELSHWRDSARGALAEIILLDQFSRNMFRDDAQAFVADPLALCLAQNAIEKELDKDLSATEKGFLYMPFMHSESLKIHEQAVIIFDQPGLEHNLDYEHKHKIIIDRFGRYPHRNKILGRKSTSEEIAFLKTDGSSF